jgi:2-polyprenyl-3-methyl-5-hydroxy-6-metoxy-1,4-benzoquinol methylase
MGKQDKYYSESRVEVVPFILPDARSILDVGCGNGYFLKLAKDKTGAETWGLEYELNVAEEAKCRVDKVLTGSIESLADSLPDKYFDCIVFNDILEHLYQPELILEKVRPKLSEKGIIIASIPNVRYISNLVELILRKEWEYKDEGILDSTHIRFFTQKSMRRIFEEAGLSVTLQVGINEFSSIKFRIFNALTFGFFADTKYLQFVCVAKPV